MTKSNRKFKPRHLLALAALVFLTWFLWQLFRPSPPIRISRETTYITEPLRADGLPDYVSYLRQQVSAGVTPENNAAVLMWQAFGPGIGDDSIDPKEWKHLVDELGLRSPASAKYIVEPSVESTAKLVGDWIYEKYPEWQRTAAPRDFSTEDDLQTPIDSGITLSPVDLGFEAISRAMRTPWQRSDLPPLADWVQSNDSLINLLSEATQRPRFYSPLPTPEENEENTLLNRLPMNGIMRSRAVARILVTRAMFRLDEGRHADAWSDLQAIRRWARLVGKGPTLVEQLVAMALDGIACSGDEALLSADTLSAQMARQIHQDLRTLQSPTNLAECYDEGERIYFLDSVVSSSREGIGKFYADNFRLNLETLETDMPAWQIKLLNLVSADWNLGLAEGNRLFDQAAAASKLPTFEDRQRAISDLATESFHFSLKPSNPWRWSDWAHGSVSVRKRNEMLTTATIETISSAFDSISTAQDRATTTLELTQLAAALAVYRAEKGEYPGQLDQLVPDIISTLPVDLYHSTPFVYLRDGEGYLLYSTGPNGVDDGGSNELYSGGILAGREKVWDDDYEEFRQQIPAGADDIAIRLPRPPFKLPEPPDSP